MMNACEERIKKLEEETARLKCMKSVRKNLKIGDTFEIAGVNWKILDIDDRGYLCLADCINKSSEFDSDCNNWVGCNLRNELNTSFFKKLSDAIGKDNIIEFERDLLSIDGQTEYGKCEDRVSLLAFDEYRKYRKLIPNTDDYYWWTITPDSTKCNDDSRWVAVVSPSGDIGHNFCNVSFGVRPFCIFSSKIFES